MRIFLSTHRNWLFVCFIISLSFNAFSQPFRYAEKIFSEVDTLNDVEYATAEWLNNPIAILSDYNIHDGEETTATKPLYMDIFKPKNDTLTKRPAIIFSHSGAFIIGSRKNDDMIAMCDSFAQKGYVTATIEYRLGMGATVSRLFGAIVGLSVDEDNAFRAAYRAVQDSRAAIRFLKQNADEYGIDSSRIFMVGSSAGAIQSLSTVYMDKSSELPESVFSSPSLGGLDAVGVSGSNSKPNAVVELWGAVWDTESIENNDTPMFLVHGEDDEMVPFKKGTPLDDVIPDNPLVSFTMPETYGSYCIDTALQNRGISAETYFVAGQNHEFYGVDTGEFTESGPNQYWDSIQQKTTAFLFKQIQPTANFNLETDGKKLTTVNESSANYSVSWNFGDGSTSTDWQPEHTYETAGTYKVSLQVCNEILACDTTSTNVTIDVIQDAVKYELSEVNIYPNPASGELNISGFDSSFDFTIYDLTGRIQLQQHNISSNKISVQTLNQGIYILKLQNEKNTIIKKFVKAE